MVGHGCWLFSGHICDFCFVACAFFFFQLAQSGLHAFIFFGASDWLDVLDIIEHLVLHLFLSFFSFWLVSEPDGDGLFESWLFVGQGYSLLSHGDLGGVLGSGGPFGDLIRLQGGKLHAESLGGFFFGVPLAIPFKVIPGLPGGDFFGVP